MLSFILYSFISSCVKITLFGSPFSSLFSKLSLIITIFFSGFSHFLLRFSLFSKEKTESWTDFFGFSCSSSLLSSSRPFVLLICSCSYSAYSSRTSFTSNLFSNEDSALNSIIDEFLYSSAGDLGMLFLPQLLGRSR